MAVLGGPAVADEFKATTAGASRLMNRIKQLREENAPNSNNINPEVPAWVRNAASNLDIGGNSSPVSSSGVAGLGETATAAETDAYQFNQEVAAKKLAAQQAARNAQAQKDLLAKINKTDMAGKQGKLPKGTISSVNGDRAEVISAAESLIGSDYVYGGGHAAKPGLSKSGMAHGSKTYGIDCSGLVRYAFAKAGLGAWDDQANAATQSTYGRSAPIKSLLPGDLVVRGGRGSASHIAIYLGNGMILEAQKTGTKVHIRSIGNGSGFTGIHLDY